MDLFQGTQRQVRNSRRKRAISVRATEVLLYNKSENINTKPSKTKNGLVQMIRMDKSTGQKEGKRRRKRHYYHSQLYSAVPRCRYYGSIWFFPRLSAGYWSIEADFRQLTPIP